MDKQIVDHITGVINRNRYVPLSSLFSRLNGITKKQRAHLNKVGIENFVTSHPNDLAIIDGIVVVVGPSIPTSVQQPRDTRDNTATDTNRARHISASSESSTIVQPTDAAIESIKQDIEKNNFCIVCSEDMEVYAFGICFHPICYKCSTKLRVLCNDKHCPCCRSEIKQVFFTMDLTPEHKLETKTYIKEQKYGISFQSSRIRNLHRSLLEHNCNKPNCGQKFNDFDDLKRHMKAKHGEYFCEICVQQCKIFTHDRLTYSTMELEEHEKHGDSGQGSAHEGHPLCQFCEHRYLDRDELLRHLQQHHWSCHVCSNIGFVFYSDTTELWEHFVSEHHACLDPECYLENRSSVYDTKDELLMHQMKKHSSKKGKSSKRLEQPIVLDVKFGSHGGLQFNGSTTSSSSASRSFKLPPTQDPTVAVADDGSMRCYGTVVNVTSWYGFIQPEKASGRFMDNVFFNKQSCGLDDDEDLEKHIHHFQRVYVHARPSENHRSKWRAVDVTLITDDIHTIPKAPFSALYAEEENGSYTSDLSLSESHTSTGVAEPELGDNEESFPALTFGSSPPLEVVPTLGNWSKIIDTKKPQKRAVKPVTVPTPSTSQPKSPRKTEAVQDGMQEVGFVHYRLSSTFGFLTRPTHPAFEDNIYFNLQAYQEGMGEYNVKDLTTVLNINQKICYILEEPGKLQRQSKSKYRAAKVWKFGHKRETGGMVPKQSTATTTSKPNIAINNKQPTKQPTKSAPSRKKSSPLIKQEPKTPKSEVVKPTNGWITIPGKKPATPDFDSSNPLSVAGNQHMVEGVGIGLDSFDIRTLNTKGQMNGYYSRSESETFRTILGEIFGGDSEDALFAFETELAIHRLPIEHVAYVHFSITKPPRVVSVLLSSSPRCRQFGLKSSGFQRNVMDMLTTRGLAMKSSDDLYYINQSSIYVMLIRGEGGVVRDLYIHTSFGKA